MHNFGAHHNFQVVRQDRMLCALLETDTPHKYPSRAKKQNSKGIKMIHIKIFTLLADREIPYLN
jgi:hypothetical protein